MYKSHYSKLLYMGVIVMGFVIYLVWIVEL